MDFELNIYGADDEIIKTYRTAHVRWGVFIQAMQLQEQLKSKDERESFESISRFVMSLFDGMTVDELNAADCFDVMAIFTQLVNKVKKIDGGSKNA